MENNKFITIPTLEKWQHYKDRCPPWIKLHRDVLNDYKFSRLQDASKAHLLSIWLLASQMDNKIPYDEKWIAQRINATCKIDFKGLLGSGMIDFFDDDSNVLADCNQNDIAETETETETETEKERGMFSPNTLKPENVSDDLWKEFLANRKFKKLVNTELALTTITNSFKKGFDNGFSYDTMISEYVASGWKRFDYKWINSGSVSENITDKRII